jgi:beta-lactamase regulating signal transducer with metallopeptidase domain
MNPDLLLGIVATLAGFVLKTTFAFGVCLALSWLAGSPSRRFMVWLCFLFSTTAYWLWLADNALTSGRLSASASSAAASPPTSTIGALQIPGSWSFPLGVALRVVGAAYLLALAYILFIHIRGQWHLKWVLRFTTKPPVKIAELFHPLAKTLHVGRARLLVLSGITSPATFGWIRPTILLPNVCLEQDCSELEDILRHELQHIRRWDFVWNGLAIVCRALLFFHPAAWYAVRKMQFERELACDLAVVSDSPGRRARYAESLLHFARLNASQDPRAWGIDFAAPSEHLKVRVHSILSESKRPSIWLLGLRIAGGLTLLAGFLGVAPSLAVPISYAHEQVSEPQTSQPLTLAVRPSYSAMAPRARARRKGRLASAQAAPGSSVAVASLGQTEPAQHIAASSTDRKPELLSGQNGSGPQLLHRSGKTLAPDGSGKQQTVALVDTDASGQVSKNGDHDKKEALQQSVTAAAGIYKRLGAVDRH